MKTRKIKEVDNIYTYLEKSGVLNSGSHEEIQKVRKQYWKEYRAKWRRDKRKNEKEFSIYFDKDELAILAKEAKRHRQSRTSFIKQACFAYINTAYIAPDLIEIRKLSQYLSMIYTMVYEAYMNEKIDIRTGPELIKIIRNIENILLPQLFNPPTLESYLKDYVRKNPEKLDNLQQILSTAES